MSGQLPHIRGHHARRNRPIRRASTGLSPVRAGALLGMLLTGAAIYGVGLSTAFRFERLEIDPLVYTAPAAVRAALAVAPGENLFQIQTEPLVERIRTLPTVLDARVEVSLPDTLVVHVVERVPILVWRVGEVGYLVDGSGTLFVALDPGATAPVGTSAEILDERSSSAGTLRPGSILDPVDFDAASRLAAVVPADIGSVADRFHVAVTDANGFVVFTQPASWTAVFGFYTPSRRTPELVPGQVRLLRSLLADREAIVGRIILATAEIGTYVLRETPKP